LLISLTPRPRGRRTLAAGRRPSRSPALPGLATGQLAAGDAQRFAALLLAWPALPRGRFDALVADFSAVARGEAAADALLAYEL